MPEKPGGGGRVPHPGDMRGASGASARPSPEALRGAIEVLPGIFISGELCAYLESERAVVVADLHLGFEAAAAQDGVFFPRRQKPRIERRLRRILELFRPDVVAVAGDFKHNFGRSSTQEWREVEEVLDFLDTRAEVALVRGNHDNYLQSIIAPRPLPLHIELGGALVLHGHKDLPRLRGWRGPRVLAHEHPSLKLRDEVGAVLSAPAFLVDRRSGTLLLPALSPLAPGSDVVRAAPASPVLRSLDTGGMEVFAADRGELLRFGSLASLRRVEASGR